MSQARGAIAISDIHLGLEASYLHAKHPAFADNREILLGLLQQLGPQDELVLNGDLLELTLAGLNEVYRDLREFLKLLSEAGPYKRIVYIPGNHDHHFWRNLVELMCINSRIQKGMDPPSHFEYPYCFVDERFSSRDPNKPCPSPLELLWPKGKQIPEIVVKYPHHLLRVPMKKNRNACYFFTHGHFLEDLFKPVNFLIKPALLEELEAFNNIWLEAFNYHIGHAGKLSDRARELLKSYEKGGMIAKFTTSELIKAIDEKVRRGLKLLWPQTWLLRYGFRTLIRKFSFEKQSGLFNVPVDERMKDNISNYIQKFVLDRYSHRLSGQTGPGYGNIPTPFTFIFGHTHQPIRSFGEGMHVTLGNDIYPLANTGGWLRTDGTASANGENAGVLWIGSHGLNWKSLEGKLK